MEPAFAERTGDANAASSDTTKISPTKATKSTSEAPRGRASSNSSAKGMRKPSRSKTPNLTPRGGNMTPRSFKAVMSKARAKHQGKTGSRTPRGGKKDDKRGPCYDFQKHGTCKRGDSCPYKHIEAGFGYQNTAFAHRFVYILFG